MDKVELSAKGLGCFLSGSYAGTEQRGGMLGYVQSDDEHIWAAKAWRQNKFPIH
jgi:hypothetical protein